MSLFNRKHHKRHKRSDSFHQRQIRFFIILFGLGSFLFIAWILWLLNRGPAALPIIR
jgi:hypothetical protein